MKGVDKEHNLQKNDESFKSILPSLLAPNSAGVVHFDETITEEMARDIYYKHLFGYYNNSNKNRKSATTTKTNTTFDSQEQASKMKKEKGATLGLLARERRGLLNGDGEIDKDDKQYFLDMHNDYRVALASGDGTVTQTDDSVYPTASNMNFLFWDQALEAMAHDYAVEWSDGCGSSVTHNSDRNSDFYSYTSKATFDYPSSGIYIGENIAVTWTTSSAVYLSRYTARIDDWWEEYSLWDYDTFTSSDSAVGHFTQMAWAKTRYVGCGVNKCNDGTYNKYFLVCNYYPTGNYYTQYPYETGM